MKSRLVFLLLIAGLLAVLNVQKWRRVPVEASPLYDPSPEEEATQSPGSPIDDDHDRLDPEVRDAILTLERIRESSRALDDSSGKFESEPLNWRELEVKELAAYDTGLIRKLAEAADGRTFQMRASACEGAIFYTWALREPDSARAEVIRQFLALPDKKGGLEGVNIRLDEVHEDFHEVSAALAERDPDTAWRAFQRDEADHELEQLVNFRVMLPPIFESYAAKDPGKAWQTIIGCSDAEQARFMLEGFLTGAAARQDWDALTNELLKTPQGAKWDPQRLNQEVAMRWLLDAPDAALEWFAIHSSTAASKSAGPAGPESVKAKADLLKITYRTSARASKAVVDTLSVMIERNGPGDAAIVRDALSSIASQRGWQKDIFSLLPEIRDPGIRAEILLRFARSLHPASSRDFATGQYRATQKLEPLREMNRLLELSPEAHAEVDEVLRDFEKKEAEARAEAIKEKAEQEEFARRSAEAKAEREKRRAAAQPAK